MQDPLHRIAYSHTGVSSSFVETLVQSRRDESFTGVMHLQFPSSEGLAFTFRGGIQQKLYRFQEQCVEIVERQFWEKTLDRPDASVSFLNLTEDALRFLRVVLEAPVLQTE